MGFAFFTAAYILAGAEVCRTFLRAQETEPGAAIEQPDPEPTANHRLRRGRRFIDLTETDLRN